MHRGHVAPAAGWARRGAPVDAGMELARSGQVKRARLRAGARQRRPVPRGTAVRPAAWAGGRRRARSSAKQGVPAGSCYPGETDHRLSGSNYPRDARLSSSRGVTSRNPAEMWPSRVGIIVDTHGPESVIASLEAMMLRLGDASLDVLPAPLARSWGAAASGAPPWLVSSDRWPSTFNRAERPDARCLLRSRAARRPASAVGSSSREAFTLPLRWPSGGEDAASGLDGRADERGAPPVVVEATLDSDLAGRLGHPGAAGRRTTGRPGRRAQSTARRSASLVRRDTSARFRTPPIIGSSPAMTTLRTTSRGWPRPTSPS